MCASFRRTASTELLRVLGGLARKTWNPTFAGRFVGREGALALTGNGDDACMLWDTKTGEELAAIDCGAWVLALDVTQDGRRAIAGCRGGKLELLDLEKRARKLTLGSHRGDVTGVKVTTDDRHAVSAGADGHLRVWDLEDGSAVRRIEVSSRPIRAVDVNHEGTIVMCAVDGEEGVRSFTLATGAPFTHLWSGGIEALALTRDGLHACIGREGRVSVVAFEAGDAERTIVTHATPVRSLTLSLDGKRALSCARGETAIAVLDVPGATVAGRLEGHVRPPLWATFSNDRRRVLSGGGDGLLRLWDAATGRELWPEVGHRGWVYSVAQSQDGRLAVSGGIDRRLRLWDPEAGTLRATTEPHHEHPEAMVHAVAVSPDGTRAASGGRDNKVKLWDTATAKPLATIERHAWREGYAENRVNALAFSSNGQRLLSGSSDKTARVFDVATATELVRLEGHKDDVECVAYAEDGRRALTGARDKQAILWDLAQAKPVRTLGGHEGWVNAVALHPDGRRALTGSAQKVRLFDLETGTSRLLGTHADGIYAVAFTPDGRRALSSSLDRTIRVYDVERATEIDKVSLAGATDFAVSLSVAADGRSFLAGTGRGAVMRFGLRE